MPKKVKEYFFPSIQLVSVIYQDSQEARDLDQAQTSAMNSQIFLFWWMKINAPKR